MKCEFEEFCYITARCHQIHHNIMNLKSKIRRERNELNILIRQEKNMVKLYCKKLKKKRRKVFF